MSKPFYGTLLNRGGQIFRVEKQNICDSEAKRFNKLLTPIARELKNVVVARKDILIFRPLFNKNDARQDVGGAFAPHARLFAITNKNVVAQNIFIIDNGDNDKAKGPIVAKRVDDVFKAWKGDDCPKLSAVAFFGHGEPIWIQFGFFNNPKNDQKGNVKDLAKNIASKSKPNVRVVLYCCLTGANRKEKVWWESSQKKKQMLSEWAKKKKEWNKKKEKHEKERKPFNDPEPLKPTATVPEPPGPEERGGQGSFAFALRDNLVECFGSLGETFTGNVDAHTNAGHSTQNPYVRRFLSKKGDPGQWIVEPAVYWPSEKVAARSEKERFKKWIGLLSDPKGTGSILLWSFPMLSIKEIREYLDSWTQNE